MAAFLVKRLLWLPVLLNAVGIITFALGLYGPGDPVDVMLGPRSNPEAVVRVRRELGLDRPFFEQYVLYVDRALHGDFGESLKYRGQPVGELIAKRLWVSLQLNLAALALGLALGIPLGIMAAIRHNSWMDFLIVAVLVAIISLPAFAITPILSYVFSVQLKVLPAGGWEGLLSKKAILPVIILAVGPAAVFMRQTRAAMLEVLGQDYVRTARAKGLSSRVVLWEHAFRNALIPLSTIFGLILAGSVTGSFVVENLLAIPGIGALGVDSLFSRDYPVIIALTLIIATSYVLANTFIDLTYQYLDPRIRLH
ncbi:MAG: ABC transporter permease [Chloroflexi bacterium]|nr:ABC transporter permease [Chloroflexota bacterium]